MALVGLERTTTIESKATVDEVRSVLAEIVDVRPQADMEINHTKPYFGAVSQNSFEVRPSGQGLIIIQRSIAASEGGTSITLRSRFSRIGLLLDLLLLGLFGSFVVLWAMGRVGRGMTETMLIVAAVMIGQVSWKWREMRNQERLLFAFLRASARSQ